MIFLTFNLPLRLVFLINLASNASKSMPAFAFQSAPVQSVNQQQGFAQFNSSVNQQGFANFNAPPVQQQSQGFANFNHVHQQPQGFAQQPQGFANFNQPAPQVFNQPAQGFASFNQSTTSFNQAQGFTQPQQPQGFAQPSQQGIANFKPPQFNNQQTTLQTSLSTPIKSKDAFSNLVSLDAMSLSSNAKKQQVGGPSLNSIQTSVSNAAFGYGNVVSPGVLASPVKGVQPNMGNQGGNFDSLI